MAKKAAPKGATKKRKVSGKRGSPGRGKDAGVDPRGVAGIVVLCVGLLALISQFIPSGGGLLNGATMLMRGLGGTLCLLLPVVMCWAGVTLVFFKSGRMSAKTMICGAVLFLFVETLLQLFEIASVTSTIFADGQQAAYLTFLARSYRNAALTCKGGGMIGALLAWPLYCALDVWGSVIVLIFACMIVLMVFTGVSFTGVGMYLSELLDDLRTAHAEHKEEREALRESREEEALRREAELAQQRELRRMERERQTAEKQAKLEAEARAALEAEHEAAAARVQEEDESVRPARKRKAKPQLEVVKADEAPQDQPPIQAAVPKRQPTARKHAAIREDMPLYIERDDEFTRESIDMRNDTAPVRRRQSFTMEEAENAFLYGLNSEAVQPAADEQPVYAPEPVQPLYIQEDMLEQANDVQAEEPEISGLGQEPEEDEMPFWKENPDMEIESYTTDEAQIPEEEDEPQEDVYDEPVMPYRSVRRAAAAQAANVTVSGEGVGSTPLSRSIAAAVSAANRDVQKVQNVLAAQEAAVKDQTIVQLRGSRLDGTPLVVPRKETHEAPKVEGPEYIYPPIDLLNKSTSTQDPNMNAKIQAGAAKLLATLESFGVQAKLTHVTHGPAITRYELQPAPGVKVSRIVNLVDDIALNMASDGVRIEAPIPGKPAVGIEIPNDKIETVSLRDILESQEMMREKSPTAVALGKGISGAPVVADMAKMPHVLIAGATGSGKSVCINTIINSIIYRASPKEVRLILIDPKVVELSVYNGIPHLLVPVVTDPKKASAALSWAVVEMEHRYKRFETMGVRNIKGYNDAIGPDEEPMSKIIVIIDELADLMMVAPGEVEESICRLAQLARAAGIHLVIATQRPSVNVITGVIKANIPSRIAFAVSSQIDSRTILDSGGAEKLLGRGDMLYAPQGAGKPTRVQGCFVSDDEVQRIVDFVRGKHTAEYDEDVLEQMNAAAEEEKAASGDAPASGEPVDEMLSKAIELAVEAGQVSISMLQRRLRVGYARAGRLVDEMTLRGITGEAEGPTKPRTVLISREEWRRMQENQE